MASLARRRRACARRLPDNGCRRPLRTRRAPPFVRVRGHHRRAPGLAALPGRNRVRHRLPKVRGPVSLSGRSDGQSRYSRAGLRDLVFLSHAGCVTRTRADNLTGTFRSLRIGACDGTTRDCLCGSRRSGAQCSGHCPATEEPAGHQHTVRRGTSRYANVRDRDAVTLPRRETVHSSRSSCTGSARAACLDGRQDATSVVRVTITIMTTQASGSRADTP